MPDGDANRSPNNAIVAALKVLADHRDTKVLGSPEWFASEKCWAIPVEINPGVSSEFIPPISRWFVAVSQNYPSGEVRFYPAKSQGIICTFPHQALNVPGPDEIPWRKGKLCLQSQVRSLGGYEFTEEPHGDPELKMLWYADRAVLWLIAAVEGNLLKPGDPFELPEYPDPAAPGVLVVHDENSSTLSLWAHTTAQIGRVILGPCPPPKGVLAAYRFKTFGGEIIREGSWRFKPPDSDYRDGIWWLWPNAAILEPWQAPVTWGDLRDISRAAGVDFTDLFQAIFKNMKGSGGRPILLLGFPIPQKVGGDISEVHWNAIEVPDLRPGEGKPPPGFRNNEKGFERRCQLELPDSRKIQYVRIENWHPNRIKARGRFSEKLQQAYVGIIGVGALGSAIAEMLARGGVEKFILVDGDDTSVGNLCRHVLTLHDVGVNKATAVAERLKTISPHVSVVALGQAFSSPESSQMMEGVDILIDCTASDCLLDPLGSIWFRIPKLFISLSLGYRARRLYFFSGRGNVFPAAHFRSKIAPWMLKEKQTITENDEVFEGAGCWSPVFPARYDDVLLGAATAVKEIEFFLNNLSPTPSLTVFEQKYADNIFIGYDRVENAVHSEML